jgi:glutaminyl-peptide cyclotransferase
MKDQYHRYLVLLSFILMLTWVLSCSGRSGKMKETEASTPVGISEGASLKLIKIVSPEEDKGFKLHQPVNVVLAPGNRSELPDSVSVYFNGRYVSTLKSAPWTLTIPKEFISTTGRKSLKVTAFRGGKTRNSVTRFMIVYSDIVPAKNGYKVIHSYPHSRDAFTQGLVYDNGHLFEGTGQETGSTLREVELETGKVIRQHNLDDSLFGEGIALLHDRIYQITWKNKVGFVYNKSDFKLINKIYYPTEGWGLTTVNNELVMSDGTNILYCYEPEMFTVVSKIEVYDNEKKVDQLNELEYINGEIWANVWMTDLIARIDPTSGKVLGYVNLKDLLPKADRDADTDVLNGIACDSSSGRIFVTGKKWPKLFEIKVTE